MAVIYETENDYLKSNVPNLTNMLNILSNPTLSGFFTPSELEEIKKAVKCQVLINARAINEKYQDRGLTDIYGPDRSISNLMDEALEDKDIYEPDARSMFL